jgi:rSAM/selenodomain-associated transferase 2
MSAPISVIIPTLNVAGDLGPCFEALTEGLMDGLLRELILADGGSRDAIGAVADAAGARLVTSPPGRGTQLAAGAMAARGEWLLFLHADTVLEGGWTREVRRHLDGGPGTAGYFRLRFDTRGAAPRLVAGWANLRSALLALPYGDQGLLISRSLYRSVGGYPEIPIMEDVALARRLGHRRLARIGAEAITSGRRYVREGWLRRGARNLVTLAQYFIGIRLDRLAQSYERRP